MTPAAYDASSVAIANAIVDGPRIVENVIAYRHALECARSALTEIRRADPAHFAAAAALRIVNEALAGRP